MRNDFLSDLSGNFPCSERWREVGFMVQEDLGGFGDARLSRPSICSRCPPVRPKTSAKPSSVSRRACEQKASSDFATRSTARGARTIMERKRDASILLSVTLWSYFLNSINVGLGPCRTIASNYTRPPSVRAGPIAGRGRAQSFPGDQRGTRAAASAACPVRIQRPSRQAGPLWMYRLG